MTQGPPSARAAGLLEEGRAHYAEGRCSTALRLLATFVEANPAHTEARCLVGRSLARLGRGRSAAAWLRQSLAATPEPVPVGITLADVLLQGRDVDAARACLVRVAAEPTLSRESLRSSLACGCCTADVPRMLVGILREQGDAERLGDALGLLAAVAPGDAGVELLLAGNLQRQGSADEALAHCLRALELEPGFPDALRLAATLFDGLGRVDDADRMYRTALEAPSAGYPIAIKYAEFCAAHDRFEDAERLLGQAASLGCPRKELARWHVSLGGACERAGQPSAAERNYRAAFQQFRSDPGAAGGFRAYLGLESEPGFDALDRVDGSSSVADAAVSVLGRSVDGEDLTRPFTDSEVGVRVGGFSRLKEHLSFSHFLKGVNPGPRESVLFLSREEHAGLRVDLEGRKVILARCPRLLPSPEGVSANVMPLAPILLGGMLKAHGAVVQVVDLQIRAAFPGGPAAEELVPVEQWKAVLDRDPAARRAPYVDHLVGQIDPAGADVVGLSVETAGAMPLALCLGREIGRRFRVPVVVGGRGVGSVVPLLGDCPEAMIVRQEGEVPLLLFVDAVAGRRPFSSVPGLVWTEDGRLRQNPPVLHDLDARPLFELAGVPLDGYDDTCVPEGSGPVVPYQFNIGCPFLCGFCNSFSRREYRLRAPELIVADLANALRTAGVNRFYWLNHLLNCDMGHLRELLDRLEAARLDIHWIDSCRAPGMTADLLKRLRKVGASRLVWGVDCGSDRLSRLMKKGVRSAQVRDVIEASHRAGIENVVNFIVGMPQETDEDFEETCRLIEQLRPFVQRFNVAPFKFFRVSPMAGDPAAYGCSPGELGGIVGPDGTCWTEELPTSPKVLANLERLGDVREP